MTDMAGTLATGALLGFQVALSANLSGYAFGVDGSLVGATALGLGMRSVGNPARRPGQTYAGARHGAFGDCLFERIIVLPPANDLGFLLTEKHWTTEVWNTHLAEDKPLTDLTISGVGGLVLTGPTSKTFGPGQSTIYDTMLATDGPASISNTATWTFTGEPAATTTVTGLRVQVFSAAMDWTDPFKEVISFKTDILKGYDESEQRRALRTVPRYSLSFRVTTCTPLDTCQFEALLYGWQARIYGVPVWPEKVRLASVLAAGGVVASGDFQSMPSFEADGLCMVWVDQQHFEAFEVDSVSDTAVSLGSPALQSWPAGAWLVPLRRGRLASDQSLGRPTNWTTSDVFSFSCEAVA